MHHHITLFLTNESDKTGDWEELFPDCICMGSKVFIIINKDNHRKASIDEFLRDCYHFLSKLVFISSCFIINNYGFLLMCDPDL